MLFGCAAIQPGISRSPGFDGLFGILTPEHIAAGVSPTSGLFFWLNIEVHPWPHPWPFSRVSQSFHDLGKSYKFVYRPAGAVDTQSCKS